MEDISFAGIVLIIIYVIGKLAVSFRIVQNQTAQIVERLGKYHKTLGPGIQLLIPFIDRVEYILDLKEETIFVEPQECFTKDNVRIHVDGVIYIKVVDPIKAAYGITDYKYASIQLAKTTTRAVIGTLTMDKTFEERDAINHKVLEVMAEVEQNWGITVTRYEVKSIEPPKSVKSSMEQQMAAEREKRALIARSEGIKQSKINDSEGQRREMINKSEGEMQRRINEAEGKAEEIKAIADATAESIEKIAETLVVPGGIESVKLRLYTAYLEKLSALARKDTRVILPLDISSFDSIVNGLGLSNIGKNEEEVVEEIEKVVESIVKVQEEKKPKSPEINKKTSEPKVTKKVETVENRETKKEKESPKKEPPKKGPEGFTGLFSAT